ncbi:MAG TPA: transferrin receptor-like dimerization domain-containing protein [Thermoanaerobaculia bacterium]|nr:transferrin receptor-like dimerization domain-containing protein [Thermoanaerobaculia bacterium]
MPTVRRVLGLLLSGTLALAPARPAASASGGTTLFGFDAAGAAAERALEASFDASIDPADQRAWMKRLTARPHHVGSPYGKENAEFLASLFRSFGFETRIETFTVLFPVPKTRLLERVAPAPFTASLAEPALAGDATSGQSKEQLPVYNAYSIDGDVTADVVYVNTGVPKDYEELASRGIDVKGKIVLARYGGSWRGIKPKVAAEHGAVGCLIYSDPRDDGYFAGDVYPKGAFRNENGAQRGSVADMPVYAGDPLTPGIGATEGAPRLALKDAATLTKIPVLPISYADARPFLEALGGPVAPEAWRGALPLTYHIGPGPAKAHLKVAFDWRMEPVRDVLAVLPGTELPDEWILRGNHHDAWVNGAQDPISGLVAELSEAKALGALLKSGWRPRRTIVYAAWDGEEPGLIGSTEWVETHAKELAAKAVLYLNTDGNGRGFLNAGGSHSLERLVDEVARDVVDPETKVSVSERQRARRLVKGAPEVRKEAREHAGVRLAALGSGSDYSPFLQHLGIASLNLGFGGESAGGSYHSVYDSFDHFTRFGDPDFAYGTTLSKTAGRVVLRTANASTLPFGFEPLADTVARYLKEVMSLTDEMRAKTEEDDRDVAEKNFELAADPKETFVAPKARPPVPFLNFAPLQNAAAALKGSAAAYAKVVKDGGAPPAPGARKALDEALLGTERALTRPEGLPLRPWYVHQVYAPGLYTGYGVKTLPGVREAIEERRWDEAQKQVAAAAAALEACASRIDAARTALEGPTPTTR